MLERGTQGGAFNNLIKVALAPSYGIFSIGIWYFVLIAPLMILFISAASHEIPCFMRVIMSLEKLTSSKECVSIL